MANGQSQGRKFGRHRDRSPSMKSYRMVNRMATNKAKKIAKQKKIVAKQATKVAQMKTPRGTARALRRGNPLKSTYGNVHTSFD